MNARLEMLYRSGQFSKFLMHVVNHAEYGHSTGPEPDPLRKTLREELQRIENGNPKLAMENLFNITKETQSPQAYLLLTVANMEAEEWNNALTVLDILHSIEPDLPEANLLRGFIHGYFNRFEHGKECLQAAVKKAPQLRLAWIALIEMAMAEGSNHEAARFLKEALRADPRHMDLLRSQLGLLLDQPFRPRERLPAQRQVEVFAQGGSP